MTLAIAQEQQLLLAACARDSASAVMATMLGLVVGAMLWTSYLGEAQRGILAPLATACNAP
jgi:hypothetical protein